MSDTKKSNVTRFRLYKTEGKYTGWQYEEAFGPQARKWVKRLLGKQSRRFGKQFICKEIADDYVNAMAELQELAELDDMMQAYVEYLNEKEDECDYYGILDDPYYDRYDYPWDDYKPYDDYVMDCYHD